MRILAGADFHGSLDRYRWFLGEARDLQAEALILAGDLFGYADKVDDPDEDQRLNAVQVQDLFRFCDLRVLFIMGNDDQNTVLVTHSPAHGILDPGVGPHKIGSPSLRALLDRQPVLAHIHGHSHSGFGRQGRHFNVALARQKRAIVIELPSLIHLMVRGESDEE